MIHTYFGARFVSFHFAAAARNMAKIASLLNFSSSLFLPRNCRCVIVKVKQIKFPSLCRRFLFRYRSLTKRSLSLSLVECVRRAAFALDKKKKWEQIRCNLLFASGNYSPIAPRRPFERGDGPLCHNGIMRPTLGASSFAMFRFFSSFRPGLNKKSPSPPARSNDERKLMRLNTQIETHMTSAWRPL